MPCLCTGIKQYSVSQFIWCVVRGQEDGRDPETQGSCPCRFGSWGGKAGAWISLGFVFRVLCYLTFSLYSPRVEDVV
jgi:hypothetical protein